MERNTSARYQQDFFSDDEQRWNDVQRDVRREIISLLSHAFIQAIRHPSLTNKKENTDASENQAAALRENSVSLSSPIHAATIDRP
ncbi:hypothetical protein JW960_29005 [candidate division KSB1 bacterium]|nr:hypothetical protein [candidate division KSB1 bacterium]